MSIKSPRAYAYRRAGADHALLPGFGSLLGYRLGGVMMEKMFAYQEPVNGLTFNWSGMWTFGAVMIAIIAVLFMIFSANPTTKLRLSRSMIAILR